MRCRRSTTVARGCVKPLALTACRASARSHPTPPASIVVAARSRPRARRPAGVQGAARDRQPGRRARLRLRRPRRAAGLARAGRVLRVQPEAGAAADRDQHRRRGRQAQLRGQPRRPAVSLAARRARAPRAARRARRRVRPPPDPSLHEHGARRGRGRLRAARRDGPGLRPRPAPLQAAAPRARPARAAARPPARRRATSRATRTRTASRPSSARRRWVLGHRDGVGDRLADPVAAARAHGQPRRHAVAVRHDDRPRRDARDAAARHAGGRRSTPRQLAALGREFSYNDPQAGIEDGAEGRPQDRNVELLLPDPR